MIVEIFWVLHMAASDSWIDMEQAVQYPKQYKTLSECVAVEVALTNINGSKFFFCTNQDNMMGARM